MTGRDDVIFEAAWRATQGARSYQEDACAFWPGGVEQSWSVGDVGEPGRLVAVLADGMGGHVGGSLASRTACESFLVGYGGAVDAVRERLRAGLFNANRAIADLVDDQPQLSGMGSTLVGASFGAEGLEWVSVGDSPLYLYRRGEIALINQDHSLAPALDKLAAEGRISAEAARNDPRRHMLRSAVTGEDFELVDLSAKPLLLDPADLVVLASDGIHTIDQVEIARIVKAFAADGPDAVAAALIHEVEAVRDPYQDNTTVLVVRLRAA